MKKYKWYFVFRNEKTGDTPYDTHCGTFRTLHEAEEEKNTIVRHLTARELDSCNVIVARVDAPEDMDEDAALEYALKNGYYEELGE